ncbi:MAG TPA: hypothetical protein VEQ60_18880 [Longimicrobium sp.]|nr:hypothetical protein [Longimicrobium sp.]
MDVKAAAKLVPDVGARNGRRGTGTQNGMGRIDGDADLIGLRAAGLPG